MRQWDHRMKRATFMTLARRAIERLPLQFREHLAHVEFIIEDWPSAELLESLELDPEEDTLLGFYDGIPVGERSVTTDGLEPVTDSIYLFQGPLEEACETDAQLVEEIRVTLLHEIGHHFGMDDEHIDRLGYG
jgi:predicted Zn-dependent protease with MMP-like domain